MDAKQIPGGQEGKKMLARSWCALPARASGQKRWIMDAKQIPGGQEGKKDACPELVRIACPGIRA